MVIEHHYMVIVSMMGDGDEAPISVFSDNSNEEVLFNKAVDKLGLDEEEDRKQIKFVRVDKGILKPREKNEHPT